MSKPSVEADDQSCWIFLRAKIAQQEQCVACLYRALDGNPKRTGLDLAYTIQQYRIVENLPDDPDHSIRYVHGAADLWTVIIAMLKDPHKADHIYLLPECQVKVTEKDYVYDIIVDRADVTMKISKGGKILFNDKPSKFIE